MTPSDPFQSEPHPADRAMGSNGITSEFRAGGIVSALSGQVWRDHHFVTLDE
jgi:hypothetical protein